MNKRLLAVLAFLVAVAAHASKLESLPRIYPTGHAAEIAIEVHDQEIIDNIARVELRYKCDDNRDHAGERLPFAGKKMDFRFEDGRVICPMIFHGVQSHTLTIMLPRGDDGETERILASIRFFSLGREDIQLRPFKGDFHTHCVHSRHGRLEASETAAYGRRVGFDFMALSEHRMTWPAEEAREKLGEFNSGYEVIIGEESHADYARPGGSIIHMLSIGVSQSVSQYLMANRGELEREIARRAQEFPADLKLDTRDREELATSEYMADLARRFGGIAIFCHPFWQPYGSYNATIEYSREIVRRGKFDAWEIVVGAGGGDEAIFKGISWYNELLKEGHTISLVGTSDCHDGASPTFGMHFTLVLAKSNKTVDVLAAVQADRSFGVRKFDGSERSAIIGPFSYIDYAYFLNNEYFPGHDVLCARQGDLLLKAMAGDRTVAGEIERLNETIAAYRERFYYRPSGLFTLASANQTSVR